MSNRAWPVATTVRGDGVDLAVYEKGGADRPTVLLVHGYPDTHAVWDDIADRLADRYRVVAYDVRGAGASTRPAGTPAYRFEHLMADMRAVLDAVSPDAPVHLVGHDWGAIQSWEAVCTMPERFASFTSISGPCLDHVARWMRRGPRHPGRLARQGAHSWYIGFFHTPRLPELSWRSGIGARLLARAEGLPRGGHFAPTLREDAAAGVALYRANMRDRLLHPRERRTDVPVQVVMPEHDPFVTPAMAESARAFASDLWTRRIDARHWAPVTHPAELARLITEHIEQTPRPRTPAEFDGKLVVVTGAGSGIGRATALAFAERGARVIAADLDLDAAARTAELATALGPRAHAFPVDVSDAEAMEGFAATVRADHGTPDIVVNNAGIGMAGPFLDHTTADWERVLGVNLWGVIHGSRLFGAQMAERGSGHIVNTASMAAFTPSRALPAYSTSKAAVLMLSECLRAELGPRGIGVSAICPGVVNTAIAGRTSFVGSRDQAAQRARAIRAYRLRNYGPDKVAERIVAAVRADKPVVPVTPEAHAARLMSRLSPGAMRLLARVEAPR